MVSYGGKLYIAKYANPGYDPTISTYYWAPYTCNVAMAPAPAPAPVPVCTATVWRQGQSYAAGAVVSYNTAYYYAKYANPGYNPTISTYYWAAKSSC